MSISDICRREVVTIEAGASLKDAAIRMCDEHVGALVVVDGEGDGSTVTGIVTDRDLALEGLGRSGDPRELRVGHIACKDVLGVPANCSVHDAAREMQAHGVRRLLVVDGSQEVVGFVSADDLAAAISDELASLARALRKGIDRERTQRGVSEGRPRLRAMLGSCALQ